MDSVMIQDNNKWNCHNGLFFAQHQDDEMMMINKVPPPSPQDASMLETVFSKHLSAKMHATPNDDMSSSSELHARKLNGLLLRCKRRSYHKRPSHIPILSSRIIHKKKKHDLSKAFERIHISSEKEEQNYCKDGITTLVMNMKKKETMDKIVQELKDMGL